MPPSRGICVFVVPIFKSPLYVGYKFIVFIVSDMRVPVIVPPDINSTLYRNFFLLVRSAGFIGAYVEVILFAPVSRAPVIRPPDLSRELDVVQDELPRVLRCNISPT